MPRKEKAISYAEASEGRRVRLTEQVFPGGNVDAGTKEDDRLFFNLDQTAPLDLPPQSLQTAQRLSMLLYRKNGRAFNTIELKNDFVMGDDIRITANDDKVKDLLLQHWEVNEWSEKLVERLRALAVFGEQFYPVFRIRKDGIVQLSTITPLRILRIIRDKKNPEEIDRILTGKPAANVGALLHTGVIISLNTKDTMTWDIIRRKENGKLAGNAFFFAVNRISGSTRGLPDLLSSIDWLEGLDGYVWSILERASTANKIVHDIEYVGLTATEIKKQIQEFTENLKDGGAYGHNDKVKYKQQVPVLGGSDADTAVKILLKQIQAGTRFSGLFFGDSDDLTRASASELSVPVAKMIQARQNFVMRMLEKIFQFQIEQAQGMDRLSGVKDFGFELIMPNVFLRDLATQTTALSQLAGSLEVAVGNGWMENDEAAAIFRVSVEQLGPLPSRNIAKTDVERESVLENLYSKGKSKHGKSRHKSPEGAKR